MTEAPQVLSIDFEMSVHDGKSLTNPELKTDLIKHIKTKKRLSFLEKLKTKWKLT